MEYMHQPPKLLIVDDYDLNRVMLQDQLAEHSFEFLMASGGREALAILEHEDVDLILLDIMMPDIDGIHVLKRIKANERLRHIPVIMVTAMDEDKSLPTCLELGANDYVSKPVKMSVLNARVATQLSRKQAMDEVQASRLHLADMVKEKTREMEQTLSQLYQAQKMEAIGTLAGGIAHDFNNVLASITGNLYLLKRDADDADKVRQRLPLIDDVCMQASEHIRQLLCFARQESVSMTSVNMQRCVQAGCDMAGAAISSAIRMQCTYPEKRLFVRWNETQVQQILLNLITNASHALEGVINAMIRVELDLFIPHSEFRQAHPDMQDESYVRLSVRDNGCGMPPEVQDKIFEPFYTTKEEGKGTGLGLSMVIGSVSNADGIMEVESEAGKGTVFTMYLPLDVENSGRTLACFRSG